MHYNSGAIDVNLIGRFAENCKGAVDSREKEAGIGWLRDSKADPSQWRKQRNGM